MIKVSITLPNGVQITLESDSENVHEIVGAVLRDLPKELLSGGPPDLNITGLNQTDQLNISQLGDVLSRLQALLTAQNAVQPDAPEGVAPVNGAANPTPAPANPMSVPGSPMPVPGSPMPVPGSPMPVPGGPMPVPGGPMEKNLSSAAAEASSYPQDPVTSFPAEASEDSFIEFCRSLNPLGDMRRVVAAAEGAQRFLRADGVDAEELSRLFDLAGWTQPHSFTQTLRNAARSKFRWIERMPGRNGRYWVTDRGKEIVCRGR